MSDDSEEGGPSTKTFPWETGSKPSDAVQGDDPTAEPPSDAAPKDNTGGWGGNESNAGEPVRLSSLITDSWPPVAMDKDAVITQVDNEEHSLQFPLAFYEYEEFILKSSVDLNQVMRHNRPFPVAVVISSEPQGEEFTFENLTIRIHAENHMPTFTLSFSINPNNHPHSSHFRKVTVAFGAQVFPVQTVAGDRSFTFSLEDPSLVVVSVNPNAPKDIPASDFENHLVKNLLKCRYWVVNAYQSDKARLEQWGVQYWFGELHKCRAEFSHRARQWATNFRYLLKKEEEDGTNSRHPVTAPITFRCVNREAVDSGSNQRLHFTFERPPASSFSLGTILALTCEDGPLSENPPRPLMQVKSSEYMGVANPWLGLVLAMNDSTGIVTWLLLHSPCPQRKFPEIPVEVTLQRFYSSSELSKSILVRAHTYFKMIDRPSALRESQGVPRADQAIIPHNIDFQPLIFEDLDLQQERNTITPGFNRDMIPQLKRPLNDAQKEAADHCATTAGRIVLLNGKPSMLTGKRVLVTAATNIALDVLLRKTISTFGIEKPSDFNGNPRVLRIVAPSRTQVELLVSLACDPDQEVDEITMKFDLYYQRLHLARSLDTPDAETFLRLHEFFSRNGFFSQSEDAHHYHRIGNNFDTSLIQTASVCFTTTSMASYKGVMNHFKADWVVTDESANCRLDQLLNAIVWQPRVSLWVLAGDPVQLPPFVMNREKNPLGESLHARLVDRGFAGVVQLVEQHRMEENLIEFVNDQYYSGILTTSKTVTDGRRQHKAFVEILEKKPQLPNHTVITGNDMLFDIQNGFGEEDAYSSTKNQAEAKFAVELATTLLNAGVNPTSILIISPYSAQVQLILKNLAQSPTNFHGIAVHTIDSTQGDERDIVILSLARSGWDAKVGFMVDNSRVVVALTRQKIARYVLANKRFLEHSRRDHGMKLFAKHMEGLGLVRQIIVSDAPAAPLRAPRAPGAARPQREKAPKAGREPERELDPVVVPTELPYLDAIQYFMENDANAND